MATSIRPEVAYFAEMMELKLKKRDGYGGWDHLPLEYLREKLQAEVRELEISLRYEPTNEVMNECIDVANYCMFIWDILAKGKDNRENLVSRGSKQDANEAG
ncbi:hypothetical protein UFOVP661_19 [uncultured Caudovirales phage]|jgi:hypothetical protein|uniref:Uncharacterized protein n=1 Tax=uncultured Caudovirales phage TaxID=2100421 RepID=A0A6J5NFV5_9CAUD|nr:hypothetical protein UFOVP661_19 [uncultured Caudovirales phage]